MPQSEQETANAADAESVQEGLLFELENLGKRSEWLRRVARELIRDPHVAEDVAQEALLLSMQRPVSAMESPRSWFQGVVRNLARQKARGEARRVRREREASRKEALPATGDLVEELELQRPRRAILAEILQNPSSLA